MDRMMVLVRHGSPEWPRRMGTAWLVLVQRTARAAYARGGMPRCDSGGTSPQRVGAYAGGHA